jgi:peptidyl-prolyl cis-trans isomerase A (cyclophilin A)
MIKYFSLLFIGLALIACEQEKPKPVVHKSKSKPVFIEEAPKIYFKKITDKNVVERLTTYGNKNPETVVDVYTSKGKIRIRLFKDTPLHRANFILLAKSGYLHRALFSRVSPKFMAQFGGSYDDLQKEIQDTIGKYTIPVEMSHHHFHRKGAVAAARNYSNNPNKRSACDELYFVEGLKFSDISLDHYEVENKYKFTQTQRNYYKNNPGAAHIDGEHTVFGQIVQGYSVVPKLTHVETDSRDWPEVDIYVDSVVVIE